MSFLKIRMDLKESNKSPLGNDWHVFYAPSSAWIVHAPLFRSTHLHIDIWQLTQGIYSGAPFFYLTTVVAIVRQVVDNKSHLRKLCNTFEAVAWMCLNEEMKIALIKNKWMKII